MYIGLNAPKFETMTYPATYLLTRVKSRDASASKKVHRLEKSTPPPVVAVVTNMRYGFSPKSKK